MISIELVQQSTGFTNKVTGTRLGCLYGGGSDQKEAFADALTKVPDGAVFRVSVWLKGDTDINWNAIPENNPG